MKCPNCGTDQPAGSKDCGHCQIVFTKWYETQAKREITGYVPHAPEIVEQVPVEASSGKRMAPAAAVAAALGLGWLFFCPTKGLPVPPGAHRDDDKGFAVVLPPGWTRSQPRQARTRFVDALIAAEPAPQGRMGSALTVAVLEGRLPKVEEASAEAMAALCDEKLTQLLDGYKRDAVRLARVDKLDAVRVEGRGRRTIELKPAVYKTVLSGAYKAVVTPAVTATYDVKVTSILLGGSEAAYLVIGLADAKDPAQQSVIEATLNSTRVLLHPPRYRTLVQ